MSYFASNIHFEDFGLVKSASIHHKCDSRVGVCEDRVGEGATKCDRVQRKSVIRD